MDALRGLVMVLMAVDHASHHLNRGRFLRDSVWFGIPERPEAGQFFTRFATHLCAPTFLFLAGASLWLFVAASRRRGLSEARIDLHLLLRAVLAFAVEFFVITPLEGGGDILFQVMYAIGMSFLLMIPLRRLRPSVLIGLGLALVLGGEALLRAGGGFGRFDGPWLLGATLGLAWIPIGTGETGLLVFYGAFSWLAILLLGVALGWRLEQWRNDDSAASRAPRLLGLASAGALSMFVLVRVFAGYGNQGLQRIPGDPISWLFVSKYPPSVSFVALQLGLAMAILAVFARLSQARPRWFSRANPLILWGQVPFFFYIVHFLVLAHGSRALGLTNDHGVPAAWIGGVTLSVLLLPACWAMRRAKERWPRSPLRYL